MEAQDAGAGDALAMYLAATLMPKPLSELLWEPTWLVPSPTLHLG